MLVRSVRRLFPLAVIVLVVVGTAVAALAGQPELALCGIAILLGALAVAALDSRRRLGDLAHMLRLAAGRQRAIHEVLTSGDSAAAKLMEHFAGTPLSQRIESMEQRFLAVVEAERLRAGDRHREVVSGIGEAQSALKELDVSLTAGFQKGTASSERVLKEVVRSRATTAAEVGALIELDRRYTPSRLMPATGNFALDARSLAHVVDLVEEHRPRTVLELGSGTSSVWLGHALRRVGGGRLVTIDHDPRYGAQTELEVARHGLAEIVEVRMAPLREISVGDAVHQWYDTAVFEDVEQVDLLLVDGPPKSTGKRARFPALEVLEPRLSPEALILLDDADRPDELKIVDDWVATGRVERVPSVISRIAVLRRVRPD